MFPQHTHTTDPRTLTLTAKGEHATTAAQAVESGQAKAENWLDRLRPLLPSVPKGKLCEQWTEWADATV